MSAVPDLAREWTGSAWQSESTLHQLSPYIGKTKSSMAASLVAEFTKRGDVVCDPFAGCGSFAFEAWRSGRHVIASDLSPYAALLTRAKLFPYHSLEAANRDLERMRKVVDQRHDRFDLRTVPSWVRAFFHKETLRDTLAWTTVLKEERRWFLLACLMGILHHQRPGFLSFPSSHTVPYLRVKKFPRNEFPELYAYRSVHDRLAAKVARAFRRVPDLDFTLTRRCSTTSADRLRVKQQLSAILTSPPYMRQLDYGRDNRLRLWFLGCDEWQALDETISPGESEFIALMGRCFLRWRDLLKPNGYCVLVIGDVCSREQWADLPAAVSQLAIDKADFRLVSEHTDTIPNERRVRRGLVGNTSETILVLRNSNRQTPSSNRRMRDAAAV